MTEPVAGVAFAPRGVETALAALVGLVLVAVAPGLDLPRLLLVGLAGAFLLGLAVTDLAVRPRLRADVGGLSVRTIGRRLGAPWPAVGVRLRPGRRFGTATTTLEIDIGEDLVVLGRRELGRDPAEVAEVLERLRRGTP